MYDARVAYLLFYDCCVQIRLGVGDTEDDIKDHVHGCTPDEGSNMLSGWKIFEGAGCVCHRSQNCLKVAVAGIQAAKDLFDKIKAVAAFFHRSQKVTCFLCLSHACYCDLYCSVSHSDM